MSCAQCSPSAEFSVTLDTLIRCDGLDVAKSGCGVCAYHSRYEKMTGEQYGVCLYSYPRHIEGGRCRDFEE